MQPRSVDEPSVPPAANNFETIFCALPIATVVVRRDGLRVVGASDEFLALVDKPKDEVVGEPLDLAGFFLFPMEWELLLQRLDDEPGLVERRELFVGVGRSMWAGASFRLVPGATASDPGSILCTFENIDGLLVARTEAEVAREAALKASQAKSGFLAAMSHEIRTPMNAIVGLSSLLAETELYAEQREFVSTIKNSSDHLLQLINEILDFSKIESGKIEIEDAPLDLWAAADDVISLLWNRAEQAGVTLRCLIEPDVPRWIRGDRVRVKQVLINLASNAIKFASGGLVTLRICTMQRVGGDVRLRLSVQDNGVGIAPEAQERIFEAFVQTDSSITRRFGGTGLGLAISKRLVEIMGGELGLESAPGRGSEFWFTAQFPVDNTSRGVDNTREVAGKVGLVGCDKTCCAQLAAVLDCCGVQWERVHIDDDTGPYDTLLLSVHGMSEDDLQRVRSKRARQFVGVGPVPGEVQRGLLASWSFPMAYSVAGDRFAALTQNAGGRLAAPPVQGRQSLRGLRVLVADDNRINRRVADAMLRRLDIEVTLAVDGADALDKMREHELDLVLMDLQMPVMNGLAATQAFREEFPDSQLAILALTADALGTETERCTEAGMDGYLTKPITLARLSEVLSRFAPKRAA